jgi:hypothetical protein
MHHEIARLYVKAGRCPEAQQHMKLAMDHLMEADSDESVYAEMNCTIADAYWRENEVLDPIREAKKIHDNTLIALQHYERTLDVYRVQVFTNGSTPSLACRVFTRFWCGSLWVMLKARCGTGLSNRVCAHQESRIRNPGEWFGNPRVQAASYLEIDYLQLCLCLSPIGPFLPQFNDVFSNAARGCQTF